MCFFIETVLRTSRFADELGFLGLDDTILEVQGMHSLAVFEISSHKKQSCIALWLSRSHSFQAYPTSHPVTDATPSQTAPQQIHTSIPVLQISCCTYTPHQYLPLIPRSYTPSTAAESKFFPYLIPRSFSFPLAIITRNVETVMYIPITDSRG